MQLIEARHITKYFGDRLILDDISFVINAGDRIGLVGENGTGKTTLATILLGSLAPDSGTLQRAAWVNTGYLPQETHFEPNLTVQAFLEFAMGDVGRLRAELSQLEAQLAAGLSTDALTGVLERYGDVQDQFTARGGYDSDRRTTLILAGLDLGHITSDRLAVTLSGGEKTRLMLAGLLLSSPSLLVLDEPTNHLDRAALEWLEAYLVSYPGAILAISHDRRFLNKTVLKIVELSASDHRCTVYHGNYDAYLAERGRSRAEQQAAYEAQQAEIRELQRQIKSATQNVGQGRPPSDNDKFAKGFFAGRAAVQQSRDIRAARRKLETLLEDPIRRPVSGWKIAPDFVGETFLSRDVIRLEGVAKRYSDRPLFSDLTPTIRAGERIVLQGTNGSGKTTLLKILLGIVQADSGTVRIAPTAVIGYLDQEQETLDPDLTVLQAFSMGLSGTEGELRTRLHRYGIFTGDQANQRIGSLSVGQQRKLQIARMVATGANVLLLDEPTNHLDLGSVEQFERALREFPGTIIAVSHDRTFAEHVATAVWTIHDGAIHGIST